MQKKKSMTIFYRFYTIEALVLCLTFLGVSPTVPNWRETRVLILMAVICKIEIAFHTDKIAHKANN